MENGLPKQPPVPKPAEAPVAEVKKAEAPIKIVDKAERAEALSKYQDLARRLEKRTEALPFKGLDSAAEAKLVAEYQEYPDFGTDPKAVIAKLTAENMKVVYGKSHVYILPFGSNDIESDGLLPQHFEVSDDMDPELKELILIDKALAPEKR